MEAELLTISIGECGIRVGDSVWQQYCFEHGINADGSVNKTHQTNGNKPNVFFHQLQSDDIQYIANNIMIDTEPDIIEHIIETSKCSQLYDKKYLIYGNENCGNNFARCYYKTGKLMIDNIRNKIRKLTETMDHLEGFVIHNSIGGGTGSGLSQLIREDILSDYNYICEKQVNFNIYPFDNQHSECSVDIYNALFAISGNEQRSHQKRAMIFDNKALYNLCKNALGINEPSFNDMNSLIALAESYYTQYIRFDHENYQQLEWPFGYFSDDYDCCDTSWVFPLISPLINPLEGKKKILCDGFIRIYYPMNAISIYDDILHVIYDCYNISSKQIIDFQDPINVFKHVFNAPLSSMMEIKVNEYVYDDEDDNMEKFWQDQMIIASLCTFRGLMTNNDLDLCRQYMVSASKNHKLHLLNFYYRGRFGDGKLYFTKNNNIALNLNSNKLKSQCVLFSNSYHINEFLTDRIYKPCNKMFSMKTFWHHYLDQGMEENQFKESIEHLNYDIIQPYQTIGYIGQTDEEYEED